MSLGVETAVVGVVERGIPRCGGLTLDADRLGSMNRLHTQPNRRCHHHGDADDGDRNPELSTASPQAPVHAARGYSWCTGLWLRARLWFWSPPRPLPVRMMVVSAVAGSVFSVTFVMRT